ncbi:MAG TPA: hypothetical protein VN838_12090 [Bradyrhizobium sp.]|nr:hypothetical protein [Bradyrhizobium sp.]
MTTADPGGEGESAHRGTALARRLYLHLEWGGSLKPIDLSRLVEDFEHKDTEIARLRADVARLRHTLAAKDREIADLIHDLHRHMDIAAKEATGR